MLKIFTREFWARNEIPKQQVDVPKYPPHVHGVPVASVKQLLEDQEELIQKIRNSISVRPEVWNSLYYPAIQNYAAFVHLLPASERSHHRLIGGLLRHGLEVAAWALQLADRHMFGLDMNASKRKSVEQAWHFGAFIGGLCHDLGKPVSDMYIISKDGENEWNPFLGTIETWAKEKGVQRYFIRWRKDNRNKRHECLAPLVIDRVLTSQARAYLSSTGPELMKQLMLALEGEGFGVLQEIVREADAMSTTKDKETMSVVEEDGTGVPVGRVLVTAMHALANSEWKVNKPGSQVWYMNEKVYVVWPGSANSLTVYIRGNGSEGIPSNPESIADILIEHGIVEANDGQRYWWISPEPLSKKNKSIKLSALLIKDPSLLLDIIPESVKGEVIAHKPVKRDAKEPATNVEATTPTEPASGSDTVVSANSNDDEDMMIAAQIASMEQGDVNNENAGQSAESEPESLEEKIRRENKAQMRADAPLPKTIEPESDAEPVPQSNINQIKQVAREVKDKRTPNRPSDYYLKRLGPTCESLRFIAEDLKIGDKKWGTNACMYKGMVALKYPATLDGYGIEPKKTLAQLGKHELIYVDKYAPNKKIIEVPGMGIVHTKAVILGEELTKEFLLLSGNPSPEQGAVNEQPAPKTAKPIAKKSETKVPANKKQEKTPVNKEQKPKEEVASKVEAKEERSVSEEQQKPSKPVKKKELHPLLKEVLALVDSNDLLVHEGQNWVAVKHLVVLARTNKIKGNMQNLVGGSYLEKEIINNELYVKVVKDV